MKDFLKNLIQYFSKDEVKEQLKSCEDYETLKDEIVKQLDLGFVVEIQEPVETSETTDVEVEITETEEITEIEPENVFDIEAKIAEIEDRISTFEEKLSKKIKEMEIEKENFSKIELNLKSQIEDLKKPVETPTIPGVDKSTKTEVEQFENHYEFMKKKGLINF